MHTNKQLIMSLRHGRQQQNKQWLAPTAAACGCCWCIRAGLSPGWCLRPPCSTTARSPHPLHCPRWQKSSIKCTSSSPTAASCLSSPPATATQKTAKENSEIAHFLCHHLMQLCHFFARRLLIFLFPWWPNLPTEISQPPGKILTDYCLRPLWPPKCQQTLWKSGEIVQFFIQLYHFSSCHLQNFMLLPWSNRNRNILAPDKITTGQCPHLSDHQLPKRTV